VDLDPDRCTRSCATSCAGPAGQPATHQPLVVGLADRLPGRYPLQDPVSGVARLGRAAGAGGSLRVSCGGSCVVRVGRRGSIHPFGAAPRAPIDGSSVEELPGANSSTGILACIVHKTASHGVHSGLLSGELRDAGRSSTRAGLDREQRPTRLAPMIAALTPRHAWSR
jgi:hypothetical protein